MADLRTSLSVAVQAWRDHRALASCDEVGLGAWLAGRPYIRNRGRIEIGERLRLTNRPVVTHLVVEPGAHVKIGDDVHIEHGCGVAASCSIRLGHRVTVGPFTLMMDTDYHVPGDPTAKPPASPIRIGNDVHIGSRVVVLRGADIGDGAWVGDGSVVSGTIPAGTRVAGVPARPIERPLQTASTDVRERVQQVVQRALRLPALPAMSQGPGELPGWDSLGALSLLISLEEAFDVRLPADRFARVASLHDVVAMMEQARHPGG